MPLIPPYQVSEIELIYKSKTRPDLNPQITSSQIAYDIFMSIWSDKIELVEEFNVLFLNRAMRVIGFLNLAKGSTKACLVDPKILFVAALKANTHNIVLAHNHPSSSLKPSQNDIDLTKKLYKGAELLELTITDHLIVTPYDYFSFADEGML